MTTENLDRLDNVISPELAALTSAMPPQSLDLEITVLGGILLDPQLWEQVNWLKDSDFADTRHAQIFTAIAAVGQDQPPNLGVVANGCNPKPNLMMWAGWQHSPNWSAAPLALVKSNPPPNNCES
ncbi:MAG: hypothetical protein F6J87_28340 [Spirulina sp. SIO3F2]|nr:hypothetical protein [Spirulina sp. SIO3F2]